MKSKRKMEDLKGTMSPQAHAHVDKKHFKMVGLIFSNVREAVFICLNRVHLRKISSNFSLQTFFSNYRF